MPGMICSVAVCKSNSVKAKKAGEKTMFFRFPKDEKIREEWVRRCYREAKFDPKDKRICQKHFRPQDFQDEMQARLLGFLPRKLKPTAIPSLLLRPAPVSPRESGALKRKQKKTQTPVSRQESAKSRRVRKNKQEKIGTPPQSEITTVAQDLPSTSTESPLEVLQRQHADLTKRYDAVVEQLRESQAELDAVRKHNAELQQFLQKNEKCF